MKRKRLTASLMACALVLGTSVMLPKHADFQPPALTASAEQYESLTYTNHGTYIEITGCDNNAEIVAIPAEIDGVPVTKVKSEMFVGHTNLKTLIIPDSENKMTFDWTTFARMSDKPLLTSLTIGNSIENIPDAAFQRQTELQTLVINEGVKSIGKDAFFGCKVLTSATLPKNMDSMGSGVFDQCNSLRGIVIPNGVTTIGSQSFQYTGVREVTIPTTVKTIEKTTFFGSTLLTDVYYTGTEEQWKAISIDSFLNDPLLKATIHYQSDYDYSVPEPTTEPPTEPPTEPTSEPTTDPQQPTEAAFGDIDSDGRISAADASFILQYVAHLGAGYKGSLQDFMQSLQTKS